MERPERQVTIYQFERTSPISYEDHLPRFTFRVKCSKGTYIRTLSVDLGEKLGYAAHMSHLTRTSAAGLQLEDALTLEEIAEKVERGQVEFSISARDWDRRPCQSFPNSRRGCRSALWSFLSNSNKQNKN